jgi:5'-deoxynucleotidase YfbR-like HD superfamily hydrolase
MRKGDYIGTYTGKKFYPLDPRPEDVCLEDIAHALSYINRFNGHTKDPYSVATHSLNVEFCIAEQGYDCLIRLYGLLHDAAEAYCCDIPRPLKKFLPGYKEIEANIMDAIYKHFSLSAPSEEICEIISEADNFVLSLEAQKYMHNIEDWNLVQSNGVLGYIDGTPHREAMFTNSVKFLLNTNEVK